MILPINIVFQVEIKNHCKFYSGFALSRHKRDACANDRELLINNIYFMNILNIL